MMKKLLPCIFFLTTTLSAQVCQNCNFIRGDVNCDGNIDVSDIVSFGNPANDDAADVNDDGVVNNDDRDYLINYLFHAGNSPACPFPTPGHDCTSDTLENCCSPPVGSVGQGEEDHLKVIGDVIFNLNDDIEDWDRPDCEATFDDAWVGEVEAGLQDCSDGDPAYAGFEADPLNDKAFINSFHSGIPIIKPPCDRSTPIQNTYRIRWLVQDTVGMTKERLQYGIQDLEIQVVLDAELAHGLVCVSSCLFTKVNNIVVDLTSSSVWLKISGLPEYILVDTIWQDDFLQFSYSWYAGTDGSCRITSTDNFLQTIANVDTSDLHLFLESCETFGSTFYIEKVIVDNIKVRWDADPHDDSDLADAEYANIQSNIYLDYHWCTCE